MDWGGRVCRVGTNIGDLLVYRGQWSGYRGSCHSNVG